MHYPSNPTNYRRWAFGSTLALVIVLALQLTFTARSTWQIKADSRYVKSAQTALQTMAVLQTNFNTAKMELKIAHEKIVGLETNLITANNELRSFSDVNSELRKQNNFLIIEKEMVSAKHFEILTRSKEKYEMLCTLNCQVIRLEWTSPQSKDLKPDDLATRLLVCPLGGQYILGSNHTITCSHLQTSIAKASVTTP